ncbi:hypothetical protein GPECTOR_69g406 [Gonium pectorale]|uniref:Uncharacterized protein n=1 Tax=Gonium pectorale TaxID=33097 RepID=A0A150G3B7_GONPE|nr:hypothetical protein GPECTOR_69g406 [Gonium pectorale]|eukprot:KXZ44313.1 hypothetical protein GPECTOR_69g406 [Gonium pectorale]
MKSQLQKLIGGDDLSALPGNSPVASDEELAEKARQAFLEVERLLGQKSGSKGRVDGAAIAVLEAENERLRLEATTLLMRQQQLEELLEKHSASGKIARS